MGSITNDIKPLASASVVEYDARKRKEDQASIYRTKANTMTTTKTPFLLNPLYSRYELGIAQLDNEVLKYWIHDAITPDTRGNGRSARGSSRKMKGTSGA